ncbi:MAG: ATP-dependent helicase [Clostridiaceae bacterium]|nr:ATP-dependent helicase [Clostridiaceae bacterium]
MLVLAGPGSGKTRVITERISYLIRQRGIAPAHILVITFTKAAALEMRQRYRKMQSGNVNGVHFGTFHAIFFMILKYSFHYRAENIIQDAFKRDLLKRFLHETDLELQDENEFLGDLESEISRVKGERMDLAHYYSPLCSNEVFQEIYLKYQRELQRRRLIDFDDMLVKCCELLRDQPQICKMWQKQFRYILIDEFQDICQVQYDVVRLLAEPENNIFVVGDDDQSIYGFRGAKPDIMKQFLRDYSAEQCVLDINYRCAGPIVEAAGKLIACNHNRLPKKIRPALQADARAADTCVEIREFPRLSEENETIRGKILCYHEQGIPFREMAVLFRTNTQTRALSAKLLEMNIPFVLKEHVPNLYDHWIAQDILTYIRVARGNREREQVLRIINRPKRYVHRNAFTEPYVDLEELKVFYEDKDWMVDRLEKLQYDLSMLARMKPYAAVNFIRRGIGYDEYIKEYAEYRGIHPDTLFEVLDELQEEAGGQDSFEAWQDSIREYREALQEQKNKKSGPQQNREQEDAVMLLTMHGSKGLEYECVFIPDANEGVVPHSKSVLCADMEEERRMFYVAMTRAKSHLHIYYLKERFHKEVDISRFVEEATCPCLPCDTQPGFD